MIQLIMLKVPLRPDQPTNQAEETFSYRFCRISMPLQCLFLTVFSVVTHLCWVCWLKTPADRFCKGRLGQKTVLAVTCWRPTLLLC